MNNDKKIANLMNSFISQAPPSTIDHEYYDIEEQYRNLFGHSVPREMLPDSITMEEIKDAMKKCIESKRDDLFQLLGVEINEEYLY